MKVLIVDDEPDVRSLVRSALQYARVPLEAIEAADAEEALAACRRDGDDERVRVARWMVGWTLRLLGREDEALAVQRSLRAELDALGEQDPYVDEELDLLSGGGRPGP